MRPVLPPHFRTKRSALPARLSSRWFPFARHHLRRDPNCGFPPLLGYGSTRRGYLPQLHRPGSGAPKAARTVRTAKSRHPEEPTKLIAAVFAGATNESPQARNARLTWQSRRRLPLATMLMSRVRGGGCLLTPSSSPSGFPTRFAAFGEGAFSAVSFPLRQRLQARMRGRGKNFSKKSRLFFRPSCVTSLSKSQPSCPASWLRGETSGLATSLADHLPYLILSAWSRFSRAFTDHTIHRAAFAQLLTSRC